MQDTENWKEELVKEIMIFTEKNNRNLWSVFISHQIAEAEKREREKWQEVQDRIRYFYLQTDGTYIFPSSKEGDLLNMVKSILANSKE